MNFFKHLVMLALAAGVLLTVEYKGPQRRDKRSGRSPADASAGDSGPKS